MMFMTPHILKNLFSQSATRMYPLARRDPFPRARGELAIAVEDCVFCGACARKCPSRCLTVDRAAATWTLDPMACIGCGICVAACPMDCLRQETAYRLPGAEKEQIVRQGAVRPREKGRARGEEKAAA